jgi:hypothetical protein
MVIGLDCHGVWSLFHGLDVYRLVLCRSTRGQCGMEPPPACLALRRLGCFRGLPVAQLVPVSFVGTALNSKAKPRCARDARTFVAARVPDRVATIQANHHRRIHTYAMARWEQVGLTFPFFFAISQ